MSWDFSTEPEFEKKLEWMRRFMHDEVYPLEVADLDERGFRRAIKPLQEEVKRQKLWATHLPPELGGQGYGQVKLGLMHEIEGASVWGPIVFGNQAPDSGNSEILAHFGTPEQKERWLHPLLDGRIRSAFSMTEPGTAGSDPTLLASTAELDGDEWVINGHKWFTSNGMIADFLIAMVVTEPDADSYERASMIIVPTDTPGLKRVRNVPTLGGEHEKFGYGHAEVVYEHVRVPVSNTLGERGQGFLIAQTRLGPGRIAHRDRPHPDVATEEERRRRVSVPVSLRRNPGRPCRHALLPDHLARCVRHLRVPWGVSLARGHARGLLRAHASAPVRR